MRKSLEENFIPEGVEMFNFPPTEPRVDVEKTELMNFFSLARAFFISGFLKKPF